MSDNLLRDSFGKKWIDFWNPMLREVRDTFKDNSYEQIKKTYNFSENEIDKYVKNIFLM